MSLFLVLFVSAWLVAAVISCALLVHIRQKLRQAGDTRRAILLATCAAGPAIIVGLEAGARWLTGSLFAASPTRILLFLAVPAGPVLFALSFVTLPWEEADAGTNTLRAMEVTSWAFGTALACALIVAV